MAVAVAGALAVDAALAGPALRVRVTGAPVLAGAPAAGFVLRAVSVVCWLVLVSMAAINRHAGLRNAASRGDAGGGYYVVRPGDTMWGISAQLGTTVRGLAAANGIANPDVISVGQRIYY